MLKLAGSLALGVCILGLAGWRQRSAIDNFADIRRGDVLKIHYHSSGCFHQDDYTFLFRPNNPSTIDVVHEPGTPQAKSFARVNLTHEDLRQLDNLMHFYRAKKKGGCTTVDTISFEQLRGKTTIASEKIIDDTCQVDEAKDALNFRQLIARAQAVPDQP